MRLRIRRFLTKSAKPNGPTPYKPPCPLTVVPKTKVSSPMPAWVEPDEKVLSRMDYRGRWIRPMIGPLGLWDWRAATATPRARPCADGRLAFRRNAAAL